ncbi:U-box domain-containing protein 52 [Nymphaea thermarum]|nr:U-box domain-containing protein 52 [Nymphaea thermarum]
MSNLVKQKSPSAPTTTIAVAASGKKDSKLALRWALENFISDGRRIVFKILHVRPRITAVPSLRSRAYHPISHNMRKFIESEVPTTDLDWEPYFCFVYFVSKGKLSKVQTASLPINKVSDFDKDQPSVSFNSFSGYASATQTGCSDAVLSKPQLHAQSLVDQRYRALLTVNQYNNSGIASAINMTHSRTSQIHDEGAFASTGSAHAEVHEDSSGASDKKNCQESDHSGAPSRTSLSDGPTDSSFSNNEVISGELEKIRFELHHVQETFKLVQEKSDTSSKISELSNHKDELELVTTEEKARELVKYEKEKHEAADEEAEKICLESELVQKKEAVVIASYKAKEKHKLENAYAYLDNQFEKFGWEEISSATSSFSDTLRVGEGAFGSVYKCTLRHITVAVKVLKAIGIQKDKQFLREIEILNRIRHPHLLMLIGACPEHGCLVYEYMENGSLDDRLRRKNDTPPLPWFDRFRIAWEVASALLFLHSSKPRPVVHRDLKPANILLDHNLVSKIGDVGLCTLIPTDHSTMATVYKNTGLVGTYCYVDPEYQRTGLVSPKSDVFAFGVVVLQLLTGHPPMGLAHFVEKAIEEDRLEEILDASAGTWPIKESKELAYLGLRCAEFRHKDRPDLKDDILPVLMKLKEFADGEKSSNPNALGPPSHFLCPILQDVMEDPWVAPDGYTYERRAIERWLSNQDTSPMTNLPLPNKNLVPNRALSSAISEWKSRNH